MRQGRKRWYRFAKVTIAAGLVTAFNLAGCKDDSSSLTPTPSSQATAQPVVSATPAPPTTTPPTADQIAGFWTVADVVKLPVGLPESWRAELLQQSLLIRPDMTFVRYTHLAGQSSGSWTLNADVLMLKSVTVPGRRPPSDYVLRVTGTTLTASDESAIYARAIADATPIKVTADELAKAFEADKKSAGARFGGKQVEVEGVVGNLNGRLGSPYVSILGNAQTKIEYLAIGGVQFQPIRPNPWTTLWIGQPLRVTGWCAATDPYLYFATVQPIGPSRVTPLAAVDLAKQWKADAKQTIEKYVPKKQDAPLLLTGKLLEVGPESTPIRIVIGVGEDRVDCDLEWIADLKEALKTLKIGDEVQVVGVLSVSSSKRTASIGNGLVVWK